MIKKDQGGLFENKSVEQSERASQIVFRHIVATVDCDAWRPVLSQVLIGHAEARGNSKGSTEVDHEQLKTASLYVSATEKPTFIFRVTGAKVQLVPIPNSLDVEKGKKSNISPLKSQNIVTIPGLTVDPRAVDKAKTFQYHLNRSLREQTQLLLWLDVVDTSITPH